MKWSIRGSGRTMPALIAALALFALTMGSAQALRGPLELPAPERAHPENALLTNLTRAGDRLVAVGEHGVIIYSNDQGRHWHQAQVPVSATLTAVTFVTPKVGWAVGFYGLVLHTTDGGKTWQVQLTGARVNELKLARAKRALEQAKASNASKRKISRLKLDLMFAQRAVKRETTPPFLDVWFANKRVGIAIGGYGIAVRTTDGGKTWHSLAGNIDNQGGWHLYDADKIGEKLFIAGERGHVYRSADKGQSWSKLDVPYQGSFFGVIGGNQGQTVFIYGLQGRLYRSRDGGNNWQRLKVPLETRLTGMATLPDGGLVVVGASGAIACRPPDAEQFKIIPTKGRPLTAVAPVSGGDTLVLTGFGGISRLNISSEC